MDCIRSRPNHCPEAKVKVSPTSWITSVLIQTLSASKSLQRLNVWSPCVHAEVRPDSQSCFPVSSPPVVCSQVGAWDLGFQHTPGTGQSWWHFSLTRFIFKKCFATWHLSTSCFQLKQFLYVHCVGKERLSVSSLTQLFRVTKSLPLQAEAINSCNLFLKACFSELLKTAFALLWPASRL